MDDDTTAVWITPAVRAMLVANDVFPEFHAPTLRVPSGIERVSLHRDVPLTRARELLVIARQIFDGQPAGYPGHGKRTALRTLIQHLEAISDRDEQIAKPVTMGSRFDAYMSAPASRRTLPDGWRVIAGGASRG